MNNNIFQNPLFRNLSAEKLNFLMEFHNQQKPQDASSATPFFMNAMKKAQQQGITFTKDESSLLIQLIMQNMPEQERQRAQMLLMMLNKI